jgi:hypothetical protein
MFPSQRELSMTKAQVLLQYLILTSVHIIYKI